MANGAHTAHGASVDNFFSVWYSVGVLKTILLLICSVLVASADTVQFGWDYSDPIDNFRIYTGAVPHVGENVFVIPPDARRAGVEVPDDHYAWITAVNEAEVESEPSPAIQYKPTTVQLVIQQSEDLRTWSGSVGVFIFRVPDTIIVEQRLNITKTRVEVYAYGQAFSVPIPTGTGKKFFRSFVAVHTI